MSAGAALAQDYPAKPIRWIVPFPPGGGADATARIITQKMIENTGRNIIIDYRSGAGGNIGTEHVARSAPDGYTVLQTTNGHTIQPHLRKLSWDPIKDFTPITVVASYPLLLAVHPSVPARNLQELVAYAKANPGKLTYGSSGPGGPLHIGAEIFKRAAGVDILHVPYKGNAPMTLAVVSGEVSMVFDSMVGPLPNVRAGKLRALAYLGERRSAQLPDVPTAREAGVPVVYAAWNGLLAPAGSPPEAIQWLHREIVRAVGSAEVSERLSNLGYEPGTLPQAEFAALIASDLERFGRVIRETGIKVE
ncbi:MAG TPA: tripartite tricarboxylate transporter substrate binding protein [Burkholderiales bacterium]|nr:tripartite tricarboxylate transporter substrate binding protein [Burkholderiales bacterium]